VAYIARQKLAGEIQRVKPCLSALNLLSLRPSGTTLVKRQRYPPSHSMPPFVKGGVGGIFPPITGGFKNDKVEIILIRWAMQTLTC